ncbi:MAG: DUF3782 domain-containing protein [Candidatus Bathyarchaeia archaeon]
MTEFLERLERRLLALDARWGLGSEEAFKEKAREYLEKELGLRIERWEGFDEGGLVYGYPRRVEADIAIQDGKVVLMEIKAHANASDVATFKRKAELYERLEGERPSGLVLVTPYIEEDGLRAAKHMGMEVYTKV